MLRWYYDGSVRLPMVVLMKINESSLSYVMVLSIKGAYILSECRCYNASFSSNGTCIAVLDDDKIGILNVFGKNFTMSHNRVSAVFVT